MPGEVLTLRQVISSTYAKTVQSEVQKYLDKDPRIQAYKEKEANAERRSTLLTRLMHSTKNRAVYAAIRPLQLQALDTLQAYTNSRNEIEIEAHKKVSASIEKDPNIKALLLGSVTDPIIVSQAGISAGKRYLVTAATGAVTAKAAVLAALAGPYGWVLIGSVVLTAAVNWLARPTMVDMAADDKSRQSCVDQAQKLLDNSDPEVRAIAPKILSACAGKESGLVPWAKSNWRWLVAGSLVAIIVLNPVKNRG